MTIDIAGKILYDYHRLDQPIEKSDVMIVLGGADVRVAHFAAKLWKEGWAPVIICTGDAGRVTKGLYKDTEAERFCSIIKKDGVPEAQIHLEKKATNTGENIILSKEIILSLELPHEQIILVHKPYMERRAYATAKKNWPDAHFITASPTLSYEEYPCDAITKEEFLNNMVADTERMERYAKQGFQISMKVPTEVKNAYEFLVKEGFDKYV